MGEMKKKKRGGGWIFCQNVIKERDAKGLCFSLSLFSSHYPHLNKDKNDGTEEKK